MFEIQECIVAHCRCTSQRFFTRVKNLLLYAQEAGARQDAVIKGEQHLIRFYKQSFHWLG